MMNNHLFRIIHDANTVVDADGNAHSIWGFSLDELNAWRLFDILFSHYSLSLPFEKGYVMGGGD